MTDETPTPLWKLPAKWREDKLSKFIGPLHAMGYNHASQDCAADLERSLAAYDVDAAARELHAETTDFEWHGAQCTAESCAGYRAIAAALRAAAAAGNRVCALSEDGEHQWETFFVGYDLVPDDEEVEGCAKCRILKRAVG